MIKKVVAVLMSFIILSSHANLGVYSVSAEDNTSSEWTIEKAEHLAKRALYRVTQERINEIYDAGSIEKAYDVISKEPSDSEVEKYEKDLNSFLMSNDLSHNWTWDTYYGLAITRDPNDFKRKAHFMLEDIFSVSTTSVKAKDIIKWHRHLYDNTFGNYKDIVYSSIYSKAPTYYLNLLNSNKHNPNENFARELMQLFLMEQCPPLVPDCVFKHYSEDDVNSLAYILTGFRGNRNSPSVVYDPKHNNPEPREFLGETYTPDTKDPAKVIDYIFEKRKIQIADFIAWRYLKYYVYEDVEQETLSKYSTILLENDFDLEPLIKAILTGPEIVSQKSMDEVRYKNPIELLLGAQAVYRQSTEIIDIPTNQLQKLGLGSYRPDQGIFGRAGMDKNAEWINESVMNTWYNVASKTAFSRNENYDVSHIVDYGDEIDTVINKLEERLIIGTKLPQEVKSELIKAYKDERGTSMEVYSGTIVGDKKIKLLIGLILAQPEFFMQSGYDNDMKKAGINEEGGKYDDRGSIVLVKFSGGVDFLQMWAPTEDQAYKDSRKWIRLNDSETIHLANGYKLNKKMGDLYPYFESNELKIINNVGIPNSTRAHNVASDVIARGGLDHYGASGKMFKDLDGKVQQISFGGNSPMIFRGGKSISVGGASTAFDPPNEVKRAKIGDLYEDTLESIITSREFPSFVGETVSGGLKLHQISKDSKSPGTRNNKKLDFISKLSEQNIGKVYYIAEGGFDTHSNQKWGLNRRIENLSKQLKEFYDREKEAGRKVTIVGFSEFGRGVRMNGNGGTDHGEGGGVFILSNDENVDFPKMAGNVDLANQEHNWLKHEVDIRAVWNGVFGGVLGEDMNGYFENNPETKKPYNIYDYPVKNLHTNEIETGFEEEVVEEEPEKIEKDELTIDDVEEHKRPFCELKASTNVAFPNQRVKFEVEFKNHYKIGIPGVSWSDRTENLHRGHRTYRDDYEFGESGEGVFYRRFKEDTTQTVKITSKVSRRDTVDYECSVDIQVVEPFLEEEDPNACQITLDKDSYLPGEVFHATLTGKKSTKAAYFNSGETYRGRYLKKIPIKYELVAPSKDQELKLYVKMKDGKLGECTNTIRIITPEMKEEDMPFCKIESRNYVGVRERFRLDWKLSDNVVSARLNDTTYLTEYHLDKGHKMYTSPRFNWEIMNDSPELTYKLDVFNEDGAKYTCERVIPIKYSRLQKANRERLKAEQIEKEVSKKLSHAQRLLEREKSQTYYSKYRSILVYQPKKVERLKKYIEINSAKGWNVSKMEEDLEKTQKLIEETKPKYEAYLADWQKRYDALESEIRAEYK